MSLLHAPVAIASGSLVGFSLGLVGGGAGGLLGIKLAHHLSGHKHALTLTFSCIVCVVGIYVIVRSMTGS